MVLSWFGIYCILHKQYIYNTYASIDIENNNFMHHKYNISPCFLSKQKYRYPNKIRYIQQPFTRNSRRNI